MRFIGLILQMGFWWMVIKVIDVLRGSTVANDLISLLYYGGIIVLLASIIWIVIKLMDSELSPRIK